MFERFTDRARRVAELSGSIARELNHDRIGTEHLLEALTAEGEAVAAKALKSLGIGEPEVRKALLRRHPAGTVKPGGIIPYDKHAKKALELGLREALQLGHNYIGTEHLLLGLTRSGDLGLGPQVLADCGIADGDLGFLDDVRRAVIDLLRGYMDAAAGVKQARAEVARARKHLLAVALLAASHDLSGSATQADDFLFLAAKNLAQAVGHLPDDEQPMGWGQ